MALCHQHGALSRAMSEEEVTFYVLAWMDEESQGGFIEVWSGDYASCVDFISAPQAQLDIEMGVFTEFQILDEDTRESLMKVIGYEGQTVH